MAWKIDKDKLLAESAEQERQRDEKTAQLRKMDEAGETLPAKLKDEAEACNQRVIAIGEEIAEGDKAEEQRVKDNATFFGRMTNQTRTGSLDSSMDTHTEAGPDGSLHEVTTVTRDAVAVLLDELKRHYGSKMDRGSFVDQESEQLMLDMLRCSNPNYPARAASFEARRQAIAKRTKRTVVTTTDTAGGHLVPDDNTFMNQVQMAERAYGGLASVARVFTTATGAPLPIPTSVDKTADGVNVAENTAVAETTLQFGNESMGAHMVTSGYIEATEQAIQDAGSNLPTLVGMIAMSRIMRQEAQQLLLGSGSGNEYQGATVGFTHTAQGGTLVYSRGGGGRWTTPVATTFVSFLNNWKHAVNAAYRVGPRHALVLSDAVESLFSGAADTEGRPIFERWLYGNAATAGGISLGAMNILADYSFPALPSANQTGTIQGLVGDFDWFWCRKVNGLYMIRDPYTASTRFATRWIFGRRGDSHALFNGTPDNQGGPPVRRILANVVN